MIFDTAHPIGDKYIQYPYEDDPNTLYNKNGVVSEWQDISYQFAGLTTRFEGGFAEPFEHILNARVSGTTVTFETTQPGVSEISIIVNPNTWEQRYVTSVNGARITVDHNFVDEQNITKVLIIQNDTMQGHYHHHLHRWGVGTNAVSARTEGGCDSFTGEGESSAIQVLGPKSDGTNGEPRVTHETRSKNVTVRLWKRIN